MPNFDKTGPTGQGRLTGRGFGPCGMGLGRAGGFGRGRGLGRYFGWNWPQSVSEQKKALASYKKALQEELEDIVKEEERLSKEK
jgi:hypothetical protein